MTATQQTPATVELGGGFIAVRRPDGNSAILAPHLQTAGIAGLMTPAPVNAREPAELAQWIAAWGFDQHASIIEVHQVHGTRIIPATTSGAAEIEADGLWADDRSILTIKAADCAPVWFADMASRRFALIHAGWRGVADGIVAATVDVLAAEGSRAQELAVAVGPHLRPCCFEIGAEVAERFKNLEGAVLSPDTLVVERRRSDSVALDLAAAIRSDLSDVGVREEQVFVATACTRCHPELFHSYRRNGSGGPLMAAVAARRA